MKIQVKSPSEESKEELDKEPEENISQLAHKMLRTIRSLKMQNCIREQQDLVQQLKKKVGSYRDIVKATETPLKTVHQWCSEPKERIRKGTLRSELREQEFINFLMQDTVTYATPCKRYSGKQFLLNTWDEIYQRYLQQPEFHKNGILSKTTLRLYKPKYILLSGRTPLNQCLCDYCENCKLLRRALVAVGVRGIGSNKYNVVDSTLCDER